MRLLVVAISLLVIVPTTRSHASETIRAAAPEAIEDGDLGRPFNGAFESIDGLEGASLFPASRQVRVSKANSARTDLEIVESTQVLMANARGWGLALSAQDVREKQFLYFRAYRIESVHYVDTANEMKAPPPAARYFLEKAYYGRMYEFVVIGEKSVIGGKFDVSALRTGADFEDFVQKNHLQTKVLLKGLTPKGSKVMFAKTLKDIEDNYDYEKSKPAVPIFVDYKRIGNPSPEGQQYAPPTDPGVNIVKVFVDSTQEDFIDTTVQCDQDVVVLIHATGEIDINGKGMKRTPGSVQASKMSGESVLKPDNGSLQVKLGRLPAESAGAERVMVCSDTGAVKLRVLDSNYKDNRGYYEVFLLRIPLRSLPEPTIVGQRPPE